MYCYFVFRKPDDITPYKIATSGHQLNLNLMKCYREFTSKQYYFHEQHPTANVMEIWRCEIIPPYVLPTPTIDELRKNAKDNINIKSRKILSVFVDQLAFASAVASSLYAKSKGVTPVYDDEETFTTANDFLKIGLICKTKCEEYDELIDLAQTPDEINQIIELATQFFNTLQLDEDTIEKHRASKLIDIDVYDNSDAVNGFFYNDNLMWLDKSTRVGLVNMLHSAKEMGRSTVNIWYNNQVCLELDVDTAQTMLAAVELYATDCYNITASHKKAINEMTSIDDIDNYDITAGYPPRLHF